MLVMARDVVVAPVVMSEAIEPLVAKRFPAVSAVEDAYGNCEATVELEKKEPWDQILVVVAAVVVPKLSAKVKSGEPAVVASVPQLNTPVVDAFTSQLALFKLETMRLVVEAFPVETRLVKVEVAALEVAVKLRATTSPTTERAAYGEEVPMPRFPAAVRRIRSESVPVRFFV